MSYALGIDLGGSSIKSVAVTPDGQTLDRDVVEFDPSVAMDWAERVRAVAEQLQEKRRARAASLGLSAPGLAARDGRSIAFMPGRLQGLEGLDWTAWLGAPRPVPVMNDAQAALLGEAWLGAAKGFQNVILLTLGTGVGGAAMVDGQVLRGHLGRAGHLGHICLDLDGPPDGCGTPGSLELLIGNCTIAERSGGRFRATHDLVAAHVSGDAEATAIWLRSLRGLACAIVSFINILDPEAVIIGGGIARSGSALFGPLQEMLDTVEWRPGGARVKLLPAQLGELAGAYGAAAGALGRNGVTR
jgi:glucokinase